MSGCTFIALKSGIFGDADMLTVQDCEFVGPTGSVPCRGHTTTQSALLHRCIFKRLPHGVEVGGERGRVGLMECSFGPGVDSGVVALDSAHVTVHACAFDGCGASVAASSGARILTGAAATDTLGQRCVIQ